VAIAIIAVVIGFPVVIQLVQNHNEKSHEATATTTRPTELVPVESIVPTTPPSQTQAIVPDNDAERDQQFVNFMSTVHSRTFDEIVTLGTKASQDINNLNLFQAAADAELVANRYEMIEKDAAQWDGPLATKTKIVAKSCKDTYMNASQVLQDVADGTTDQDSIQAATDRINGCTSSLVELTGEVDRVRNSG
jgi:phosphoribosylaminoimidazole-succinocarboxamide synthase